MKANELKALIVDDEMLFARQLESWLKKKISSVFISNSSENGSFFISKEEPDIIFLDNQLPGINGIDVIEFYKEKSPNSTLVLMSSVFNLDEVSIALKNGADYVLNKRNEDESGLHAIVDACLVSKETGNPFWKFIKSFTPEKLTSSKNIVILEDEELFSFQLLMILNNLPSKNKHSVVRLSDSKEFSAYCEKNGVPDVLFLDYQLQGETGMDTLDLLEESNSKCKVILISSSIDIDTALSLNLQGVSEFIMKDENWQKSILECATTMKL